MSENKLHYDFDFAVNPTRWCMQLIGLWPIEFNKISEFNFALRFILILYIVIIYCMHCSTTKNILDDLDAVLICLTSTTCLIKLGLLRIYKHDLKLIVKQISEDWNNYSRLSLISQKIMVSNAKRGKILDIILTIWVHFSTFFYLASPMYFKWEKSSVDETDQILPYKSYYPGYFERLFFYESLYISQSIMVLILCSTMVAIDSFFAMIIFHLSGQFEIVARNVDKINSRNIHFYSNLIRNCNCLRCIIEKHIQLMRDSKFIQETLSLLIWVLVLSNVCSICMQSYKIVLGFSENNFLDSIWYTPYAMFSTSNIFIYCYIGEYLITKNAIASWKILINTILLCMKSTYISRKTYEVNWYNMDSKSARSILLIMIGSQKPMKLTAAKFYPISLAAFKNILMSVYSYTSFLLVLHKARKEE